MPIDEFRQFIKPPEIAWPTISLLLFTLTLFVGSSYLFLTGSIGVLLAVSLNSIAAYVSFTVVHDAGHGALSSRFKWLNPVLGYIGLAMFIPLLPAFRLFRYMHMQHHRFANDFDRDPDVTSAHNSSSIRMFFKWMALDLAYLRFAYRNNVYRGRKGDFLELILVSLISVTLLATAAYSGYFFELLVLSLIPSRVAMMLVSLFFSYLPHHHSETTEVEDPYQASQNRYGLPGLLSTLSMFQNYHIPHHLYPKVPFYRYKRAWLARQSFHESFDPCGMSHKQSH